MLLSFCCKTAHAGAWAAHHCTGVAVLGFDFAAMSCLTMVVPTALSESFQVADHECIELGLHKKGALLCVQVVPALVVPSSPAEEKRAPCLVARSAEVAQGPSLVMCMISAAAWPRLPPRHAAQAPLTAPLGSSS